MAISKNSIRSDILKEFRAVIKENLVTSGVKVTVSFTEDSANLPEVVIATPSVPKIKESFGTESGAYMRDGSIDIELFAKTKKQLTELFDDVEQAIFENLDSISVQKVELGESNDVSFDLDGKTIHNVTVPILFKLRVI